MSSPNWIKKTKAVWQLIRPFTCLAPALGVLSGTAAALGAVARRRGVAVEDILDHFEVLGRLDDPERGWASAVALGVLSAVALNIYSNVLNQVCDLDIDKMAKPDRPLVTGAVSRGGAISIALAGLFASLTWAMGARPPHTQSVEFLVCVVLAALLTTAYSLPPIRLKRIGLAANLTIAAARGLLLKVAGWACLFVSFTPVEDRKWFDSEPWLIGGIFFLFVLGAVTTKDFADAQADQACGVRSLPVIWGNRKAAWFAAVFLTLPWLLFPVFQALGLLHASLNRMLALGMLLCAYGAWTGWLLIRDPERLGAERNHPAWTHMYILMMLAQVGLAVAYLL